MRKLNFVVLALAVVSLMSCGGSGGTETHNAKGFGELESNLKSEFGADASYTDLTVMYVDGIGTSMNVTVTDDPASLQMGEWNNALGSWEQTSEITLEISEGSQASDFMFQLGDKISLTKLGELTEKAIAKLKADKGLENPVLSLATVRYPDNGDINEADYLITLEPENGGTSFSFFYTLDGEFVEMNY